MNERSHSAVTRRGFLAGAGASLAVPAALGAGAGPPDGEGRGRRELALRVNGVERHLVVEPRRTLAEALRQDLRLTGTKVACDRASCGACTVLLDGRAVFACHLLALQAAGREVVTIEGLARGERLHPIQEAFVEHDALQCGFCTPGMILAVKAALDRDPHASRGSLQHALAGNLCRCAAYPHILDAASAAARRLREG